MGSLCRSSPQTTNTTRNESTNSTQTSTPFAQGNMQQLYDRLYQVAGTPYNPYAGPLVANLDPITTAGINNVNNAYGAAQPYYNEATEMARSGAMGLTTEDVAKHLNPYTQNVVDAARANFNENNAQQQSQIRGNAALKGALGGDRAGIAQAEAARQQKLAQDPVIANMYSQSYDKAVAAAQADRAAQAQGAYTFGSLGSANQNSLLQGANNQIAAGGVNQQNQQQRLGADYQMYLNNQAQPFQQASWLAQYGLPTLQAQGQTTTGQSQTSGTQQQQVQQPQASPFSQILGAGLTAAGLFTGNPFMSLSGAGSMFGSGSSGSGVGPIGTYSGQGNPWQSSGQGMNWWADGGRIPLPRPRPILNDEAYRADPFLAFPRDERNAMRDLSSLTGTFGERQWRGQEPREPGMVNAFNEWLDKRFYDDNALKWKELRDQGIRPMAVGAMSTAKEGSDSFVQPPMPEDTPRWMRGLYSRDAARMGGFASGGSVGDESEGFLGHVRNIRKALREHYDSGGVVGRNPFARAISSIESSGRYDALGPVLKGNRQALGKYGIMEENLPQWGKDALGRPVTREEFLKSPEIQDQIFNHRFGQYVNKYGPSGAAKAWFAGERGMNNPNARDALGTSVAGYEQKFNKALGLPSEQGAIPAGDRLRLASMSAGASSPNPYAVNEESRSMSGPSNSARSRAIALGLSMLSGGGGSGFAAGGVPGQTIMPKNVMPFEARAEGAFSPFDMSQVPDRNVEEEFEALDTPPMSQPSWANGPVPATGAPFQMTPEEDVEPAAPAGGINDPNVQTAERDTTDGMSSQRQDPYRIYQQNQPQGSQGDDVRSALVAAGLGMLAGKSSNALTNIGEGGLKGLAQYNVNKKNRESAELAARRLMQQAEQFNQSLDLRHDQFERGLRSDEQKERIANKRIEAQEAAANARLKMMQDREDARERARIAREEAAAKKLADTPTPAERSVDVAFGKDYASWVAGGGFKKTQSNISSLGEAITKLESGDDYISGPIVDFLPDRMTPSKVAMRDRVGQVVQQSLKEILGGQFAKSEAEDLIKRTYNTQLSEAENADRLKRLLESMRGAAQAKQKAAEYFEQHGTLKGFKGSADISIKDIENAADLDRKFVAPRPKDAPKGAVKKRTVNGVTEYLDKDGNIIQ